jgi:hypothetical protein
MTPRAHTAHTRRPLLHGLLAAVFLCSLASLSPLASPAQAESPWWHLASGSRPAYIHAGVGKPGKPGIPAEPEVQKLVIPMVEFEEPESADVLLKVGATTLVQNGFCTPEPLNEEFCGGVLLNASNVQSALEGPYGAGKVHVSESRSAESIQLTIETDPGVEPLKAEEFLGLTGPPTVEVTNPGKAEIPGTPPVPDGEIYITAENLGDANASGAKAPIKLSDVLPAGLKAIAITATKPHKEISFAERDLLPCSSEAEIKEGKLACEMTGSLAPYDQVEMRIGVDVQPGAHTGELNQASISGGGAPPVSAQGRITISEAPVPFGVERYEMGLEEEDGIAGMQAGAHPFQFTTTIALNQLADTFPTGSSKPEVAPAALAKDLNVKLPPGLIGNPTAIPQCSTQDFFFTVNEQNLCPPDTAVGVASATVHEPGVAGTVTVTEPIFNLEPRHGEPARFGFYVIIANSPVFIDTSLRNGSDYGVTAHVDNITQTAGFLSSEATFWGVPGDSRHDKQRGWGCLREARETFESVYPCAPAVAQNPPPFLVMPTSCDSSLGTSLEGDSWSAPGSFIKVDGLFEPQAPLLGCNRLQFAPEIKVAPDGQEASKPTGLTVDVHVPQEVNTNAKGLASSNVKKITVAFPQGVRLNPAAADGLQACSEEQVGLLAGLGEQQEFLFTPTLPQAFCPDASKIGTVKIASPLLPKGQTVDGALYLASPAPNGEAARNPFGSLLAMYIVAEDPVSGTLVKLPGSASLDQSTGQLTATFDNNPQVAFEDAEIHLFGGERAPFATPAHCGTYTTQATFTPWSATAPVTSSSSFQITSGPGGGPCPPAALPFAPTLAAGSPNINAGSFSPLSTTIGREDGNQDIQAVSLHMPPGLSGILTGVTLCPEAEANAGSCPQNSLIGHTIVSVGLGGDPFSVLGGQVFLTEAYKGAPFGLSIVNPAVAGPFDLGKVIVRAKVEVDPHTAALTVSTDPEGAFSIPHILDGIPLQIKHVNVLIDRPGFTFNPTNCNPQSINGTITSDEGASASLTTPFQATNCAKLKFAPKFTVSTAGKTSKANGASLKVKLTYPSAPAGTYANVAKVKVSLPKQLPSRLTTIQKACTSQVFDQNPANCQPGSILGQAKVITPLLPVALTGPAYFVSHAAEAFPDLTIVLKGYGVTVDLIGNTQIKNGITTTTFKTTPDVPFNSFELTLPEGPHSALAANANLCKSKLVMPTEFQAQNGSELHQQTKIAVTGCPKAITNKQRLAKALKACSKKHSRAKRAACEAKARRRFRAKAQKRKHG